MTLLVFRVHAKDQVVDIFDGKFDPNFLYLRLEYYETLVGPVVEVDGKFGGSFIVNSNVVI